MLEGERRVLGPDHPDTLRATNNLAMTFDNEGRWTEAEPLFRKNLETQERILGADHENTLTTREQLGWLLYHEGRAAEAEALDRETWNRRLRTLGPDHPATARMEFEVGIDLFREGRMAAAEPLAREALNLALTKTDKDDVSYAMRELGMSMAHRQRYGEAELLFRERLDKESDLAARASLWYSYAYTAVAAGDPDGALRHLHEAISSGFNNLSDLTFDEDLDGLRQNPHFQLVVSELKRKQAAEVHGPAS